jgi:hypothetical protein
MAKASWHDKDPKLRNKTSGKENRPSASERGYDRQWRNARAAHLRQLGVKNTKNVSVDHVEPARGDKAKFNDRDNWRIMSTRAHNRKAARE